MERKNIAVMIAIALMMVGAVVLPSVAQTATPAPVVTPDPSTLVLITGPLDLSTGQIRVGEYVIIPGLDLPPVVLRQGEVVLVTGYLQPDGVTVQATLFEVFIDEPEVTQEPGVTPAFTATLPPTVVPVATATVAGTPVPCDFPNQPIAQRIAEAFNVPYEQVIAQHCAGFGFGEITRAYLLAEATGQTAQTYLDLRASGLGWGQIVRDAGVDPSQLAPGPVLRGNNGNFTPEAAFTAEAAFTLDVTAEVDDRGGDNNNGNNDGGNGNSGRGNDDDDDDRGNGNSGRGGDDDDHGDDNSGHGGGDDDGGNSGRGGGDD